MAKAHRVTRVGRLVGACAVVGALIAGPIAGSAQAADLKSFAGQGTGFALRVVVDLSGLPLPAKQAIETAYGTVRGALPAAQQAALPAKFPFVIDQRFLETLGDLGRNTQAHALLGQGTIQDIAGAALPGNFGDAFNKSASANQVGQDRRVESTPTGLPVSLPILNMGVGRLRAAIPTANKVLADGSLVQVQAGLNGLLDILPDAVKTALEDVTANVNTVIDQVNSASGTLGTALDTVGDTLATTPVDSQLGGVLNQVGLGDALGNPTEMVEQLQQLVQIPNIDDLLNTSLASINGLVNTSAAEKSASKAFADASSKIASINVLDLLKVGVVDLKSHSEATGVAGGAKNTSSCSIANVNLADTAGVSLDGKSLIVGGVPVPVPAVDIAAVKSAVNQVLNVAGLQVGLCDVANARAAADGTSASQTLSALRIVFAPLATGVPDVANPLGITQGTPLIKIVIDPSVETAASAQVAAAAPAAKAPALPHTGAGALATIITGIAVAGGALVLRRRLA